MEEQNRKVTQSPTTAETEPPPTAETEPPPTTPVPEQKVVDINSNGNTTVPVVVGAGGAGSAAGTAPEVVGSEQREKKRGRPRKYEHSGNLQSPASEPAASLTINPPEGSARRSRGRPRGSGKLQLLASMGGVVAETAGGDFTPHVLIVNAGENVLRILALFSQSSRAACILSATGPVSSVIIRQPGPSGGILRYEGRFEILSLFGSCASHGASSKNCLMSVCLAKSDGAVIGGVVERTMIAAGPIQLIMGTFKQNISKHIQRRHSSGPCIAPNMASNPGFLRVPQSLPNMIECQQGFPSPTSGLIPITAINEVPDNVITATTRAPDNVIPAATNETMPNNPIPAGTNRVEPDNVVPTATNEVPDVNSEDHSN